MFAKQAEALVKDFWVAYLSHRDEIGIDKIMAMCDEKIVVIGMREGKPITSKESFKQELLEIFSKKNARFFIAEDEYNQLPVSRSACIIHGFVSISGNINKPDSKNSSNSSCFFTYGFTITVKKAQDRALICHFHCWKINNLNVLNVQEKKGTLQSNRRWNSIDIHEYSLRQTRDVVFGIDKLNNYVCCVDETIKNLFGIDKIIDSTDYLCEVLTSLIHKNDIDAILPVIKKYLESEDDFNKTNYVSRIFRLCYIDYGYIWCNLTIIPLNKFKVENKMILYIRDINREKEKEQLLLYQSVFDSLTGCFNSYGAKKNIDEYLSSLMPNGFLILFDIDKLKWINKSAGYDVGDQVLFDFSAILKRYIREDDVIARVDKDDFIVYIKGTRSKESLKRNICEIFGEFSDYLNNRSLDPNVQCFAATSWYGTDGQDYESLLNVAHMKMSKAKQKGKRNYIF